MHGLENYVRYNYPLLPGGFYTFFSLFLILAVLWFLYRRTSWGGWLAFLVSLSLYSIPVLVEYHR